LRSKQYYRIVKVLIRIYLVLQTHSLNIAFQYNHKCTNCKVHTAKEMPSIQTANNSQKPY